MHFLDWCLFRFALQTVSYRVDFIQADTTGKAVFSFLVQQENVPSHCNTCNDLKSLQRSLQELHALRWTGHCVLPFSLRVLSQLVIFSAVHFVSFTAGFLSFVEYSSSRTIVIWTAPFRNLSPYSPEFGLYYLYNETQRSYNHEFNVLCLPCSFRFIEVRIPKDPQSPSPASIGSPATLSRLRAWHGFCSPHCLSHTRSNHTSSYHPMNKNTRQALRVFNIAVHRPPTSD